MNGTRYTTRNRFRVWITSGWRSVPSTTRPGQTATVPDFRGEGEVMTPRQITAAHADLRRVCGPSAWLGVRILDRDGREVSMDTIRTIVNDAEYSRGRV